jgi:hypothetical protein
MSSLDKLSMKKCAGKTIYLFRAKALISASPLVEALLYDFISSSEETIKRKYCG